MAGFESPNYTQTPNDLFDELMKDMGEAELKVVLAVIRNTFGWHRNKFQMSIRKLAEATGLSNPAVQDGARQAEKRGLLERVNDGQNSTYWKIIVKDKGVYNEVIHQDGEVYNEVIQGVQPSYTQLGLNKVKERIKDITPPPASDKFFDETTREGSARTRVVKALNNGMNKRHEICEAVRIHLGIDITRSNKANRQLIDWLMEVPEEQTIAGFALFWKSIFPGNKGQPPTVNQIHQYWPSAFPSEVDTEQRRMERFEAQLLKGVR